MNTDLNPELIEKAARALYESERSEAAEWECEGDCYRDSYYREPMRAALSAVTDDLRAEALRKAADDDELWKLTEGEQRLLDADTPYYEGVAYGFRIARSLLKDRAAFLAGLDVVQQHSSAVRAVLELHCRRPHGRTRDGGYAFDFAAHAQTEFPDLCDHCRRAYPCETVTAITAALEAS